jgi:HlyD family secretion protein
MRTRQLIPVLLILAVIALLTGCDGSAATETVSPDDVPIVAQDADDKVVAEAVIEPARSSQLSFQMGGDVITLLIAEGDRVAEGDLLIQLDTEDLSRTMAQAELSLRQALLQLEQLEEPPDEAEVEIARAAVSDAAAAYAEAQSNLTITEHSVAVGETVRATRAARDETYRIYQNVQAKKDAGQNYSETKLDWAHDMYLDAQGAYNRALENAELQMTTARNGVTRAYHALEQAQNSLDKLLEGADDLDIEATQVDVDAAHLALEEAQSHLEDAVLIAPFDGIVAAVEVEEGDTVAPGQVVVVLATLNDLQARTTDLTELDVARVEEGQSATVTVDALPDDEFAGVVSDIALQPGDYRGDVVYAVTVDLTGVDNAPLRWGMTALVEINVR